MATMVDAKPRDLWWFRKNVPCLDACPVKTDAGRYVQLIAEGRFTDAYSIARDANPIASICGRACGAPCEDACRRGKIDAPVTIRALKRFVTEQFGPESLSAATIEQVLTGSRGGGSVTPLHADRLARHKDRGAGQPRVAVIGAGPAGLACAHDLALRGYRVTVFERNEQKGNVIGVELSFGFLEEPNVERALEDLARHQEIDLPSDPHQWIVHVMQEHLLPARRSNLFKRMRLRLFQFLRQVSRPTYSYYGLGDEVQLSVEIIPVRMR